MENKSEITSTSKQELHRPSKGGDIHSGKSGEHAAAPDKTPERSADKKSPGLSVPPTNPKEKAQEMEGNV